MLRAPIALEKMRYDAVTGTVIYRSKMHLGLKRNFQVMPGAEWLALLLHHLPDRYQHLVRYVGWYSNRARGERAKAAKEHNVPSATAPSAEPVSKFAARAKAAWARLIRKVYERANAHHCADRRPGSHSAHPRAPAAVGARSKRAIPAARPRGMAARRAHSPHIPSRPRHRVAAREGQGRPSWPLGACRLDPSRAHDPAALRARQVRAHNARVRRPLTLRNPPVSDPTDSVPFTRGIDSPIRRFIRLS